MLYISLVNEISSNLGMNSSAKNLFRDKINSAEDDEIVLDFKNIDFMGRAFTQEYIAQKCHSKKRIIEIRKSTDISMMLFIVWGDYFYHKFPNCKKCPYSTYFYDNNNLYCSMGTYNRFAYIHRIVPNNNLYCSVGTNINRIINKDRIDCDYREDLYKKIKEKCE